MWRRYSDVARVQTSDTSNQIGGKLVVWETSPSRLEEMTLNHGASTSSGMLALQESDWSIDHLTEGMDIPLATTRDWWCSGVCHS